MVETHEQCKFGQVILTKFVSISEKLGVIIASVQQSKCEEANSKHSTNIHFYGL